MSFYTKIIYKSIGVYKLLVKYNRRSTWVQPRGVTLKVTKGQTRVTFTERSRDKVKQHLTLEVEV